MQMAKKMKDALSIPVTVVGEINDPDQAEKWIAEGYCDLVAMGRQLTANSNFPNKVLSGHLRDKLLAGAEGTAVVAIGGCKKASKVYDCMIQGFTAATSIR